MYSTLPSFVLGFHGCDERVGEAVLAGSEPLLPSTNSYDWLGNGIYFWENDPERAMEYARILQAHPRRSSDKIKVPFVLGAVIDLGYCLYLLESNSLLVVKTGFDLFMATREKAGLEPPVNRTVEHGVPLRRNLDCAIFEATHAYREAKGQRPYDSVRAMFLEGRELYEGAGFREKNHIQVCVRNPNCIKGYFRVLKRNPDYPLP